MKNGDPPTPFDKALLMSRRLEDFRVQTADLWDQETPKLEAEYRLKKPVALGNVLFYLLYLPDRETAVVPPSGWTALERQDDYLGFWYVVMPDDEAWFRGPVFIADRKIIWRGILMELCGLRKDDPISWTP